MQNIKHSVIVPCYIPRPENVIMTQKCIELAKSKTKVPFQLIVAETCSNYFIDQCDIHIYEKDRTCSAISFTRGIKLADGEYVTLLNNDVYVSDGWLERMEECFEMEDCGVASLGESKGNAFPEDKIVEDFWFPISMVKKETYEKMGYFDSSYLHGSWDDTDFLMKVVLSGKRCYRNLKCLVFHKNHATLEHYGEHDNNFWVNKELFYKRYNNIQMDERQRAFFDSVK